MNVQILAYAHARNKKNAASLHLFVYSENIPLMLQNSKPVQKRGIAGEKCRFFRHSLADTKG